MADELKNEGDSEYEDSSEEDELNNLGDTAEETPSHKETEGEKKTDTDTEQNDVTKKVESLDLSKFNKKTFKTTLPNLLTQYGFEEEVPYHIKKERERRMREKSESRQRPASRKLMTPFGGDDDDIREKEKQEHYLNVLDETHKIRDIYYKKYMSMLNKKIEKQRESIQKKTDSLVNKIKLAEEADKLRSHKVQKRHQAHKLNHDSTYLKSMHQTKAWKILQLEEKLKNQGKLRTQTDIDAFWKNIQKPEVYRSYFVKKPAVAVTDSDSVDNVDGSARDTCTSTHIEDKRRVLQSHSVVTDTVEEERPMSREQQLWAITQQFQSQYKGGLNPTLKARAAGFALDKLCPTVEMPDLACNRLQLGEKPPDPDEMIAKMEARQRDRERKYFVKRLRKMHQHAMSNTASSLRILDKHAAQAELSAAMDMDNTSLRELTREGTFEPFIVNQSGLKEEPLSPSWHKYLAAEHTMLSSQGRAESLGSLKESTHSGSSAYSKRTDASHELQLQKEAEALIEKRSPSPIQAIPLTMPEVKANAKLMEPKCISTNWTNYLGAGKSLFAKT
ncbi:unnamed protein product [Owenia fusiformis]|uniref:Uncharacterized protein n=1 Tax=Owenia fusiformis TaxID=6347 RepID=A0A8J1TBH0_OWEFU|nr:unnamed protein product [Owenia fusiformis]